jgi:uncharacterized protein YdeI (YjbR/CyaY-like superfamily)
MATKDPRVDAYIGKAPPFAKPILRHIRALVHQAVPGVEESIKWSFPHFGYKGMLCSMAAFKAHCVVGFWNASILAGVDTQRSAMGQFGRLQSVQDLPSDRTFVSLVKKAAALNEAGVKPKRTVRPPGPPVVAPDDLTAALKGNKKAQAVFDAFPPSHRREYIEWITEAKTAATRQRRLDTAMEWIAEGKGRNWKYER